MGTRFRICAIFVLHLSPQSESELRRLIMLDQLDPAVPIGVR